MKFRKFLAWIAAVAAAVSFAGCSEGKTVWTDTAERPDIQPPAVLGGYIEYPEAPAHKPEADPSAVTSSGDYTAYGNYTLTETSEGLEASYAEVEDWDYIYVSVENYQSKYGNFRISLNTKGAERIAVQAVYWEMYENGEKPVTVYQGDLADGEQYVIARLGDFTRLDGLYQPLTGQSLQDAAILGFVILVDSNPAQTAASDREGKVTFESFDFLEDDDPALEDKYVVPQVNWSGSFGDAGYTVEAPEEGGIRVEYEQIPLYSRVYIPIVNFSPDYAEFEISLTTSGVSSYSIGVMFSVESHSEWQPYVELFKESAAVDGIHTHTVNFDGANPIDMNNGWNPVPGEYIKNYNVYQIVIWFDSTEQQPGTEYSGEASVDSVTFNRTATEGCVVGKAWSANTPSIVVGDDVLVGGSGTVTYSYYTGWYKLTMPVSGYEPRTKLIVRFMSDDPVDYFGVAVTSAGSEVVLLSTWDKLTEFENNTDESGTAAAGTVSSVTKDSETGIYTATFDFTDAQKSIVTNLAFWEQTITNVGFYFNDPNNGEAWDGTRTIRFISVEFSA